MKQNSHGTKSLCLLACLMAVLCLAGFVGIKSRAEASDITVFAAASLGTVLNEIGAAYEAGRGQRVIVSAAGTPVLARQIARGAPADIFISANPDWMDWLAERGGIVPESRIDLLSNTLVLIAHGAEAAPVDLASSTGLRDRLEQGRFAMALVEAVPAGIYGKAALNHLGLWENVADRVAQSDNVRTALALVAAGEAPLGIVYGSDALAARRAGEAVSVVAHFPAESHPPIRYPVAMTAQANPDAASFLDYLQSPEARAAFAGQGFVVLTPDAR